MADDRLAALSERQRECLRLVFRHLSSKEIARTLDVSSHTVDHDLKRALRTLGVNSRVEAARMLALAENGSTCPPVVDHALGIGGPRDARPLDHEAACEGLPARELPEGYRDSSKPSGSRKRTFWSLWGDGNDLGFGKRLLLMLLVATGTVLVFALLVEALIGFGRLGLWRTLYEG